METSENVGKTRKSRKLPKAVREEEFNKLIKIIPTNDKKTVVAFLLAYQSGMRISEVLRCQKEHFRDNNSIFIPESKYGVERVVPRPKSWRSNFFNFLPIKIGERALQLNFKKYSKKAGLNPTYTFHSLRHGFAVRCLEKGMPLNQVQLLLGHSNISTTNIYVRASPSDSLNSYLEKF